MSNLEGNVEMRSNIVAKDIVDRGLVIIRNLSLHLKHIPVCADEPIHVIPSTTATIDVCLIMKVAIEHDWIGARWRLLLTVARLGIAKNRLGMISGIFPREIHQGEGQHQQLPTVIDLQCKGGIAIGGGSVGSDQIVGQLVGQFRKDPSVCHLEGRVAQRHYEVCQCYDDVQLTMGNHKRVNVQSLVKWVGMRAETLLKGPITDVFFAVLGIAFFAFN